MKGKLKVESGKIQYFTCICLLLLFFFRKIDVKAAASFDCDCETPTQSEILQELKKKLEGYGLDSACIASIDMEPPTLINSQQNCFKVRPARETDSTTAVDTICAGKCSFTYRILFVVDCSVYDWEEDVKIKKFCKKFFQGGYHKNESEKLSHENHSLFHLSAINKINVYPNIISQGHSCKISIVENSLKESNCYLFNSLGQKVNTIFENKKTEPHFETEFSTLNLSPGLYWIVLFANEGRPHYQKLIVE